MRHLSIILLTFFLFPFVLIYGQTEEETPTIGDSFFFSFIPGEADIQATYGNNSIEIERMGRKIWPAINPLIDGEYHVLIVSHIYSETGAASTVSINTAMWRGNSVRRFIKNKYGLDNKQISYYVDRSGEWGNSVHVYLLYFPMPDFANRQIFYSTDQSIHGVNENLRRYKKLPYIYVLNDPDLCEDNDVFAYVVVDNKADLPYQEGAVRAVLPPKEKEEAEEKTVEILENHPCEEKTVPVMVESSNIVQTNEVTAEKETEPLPRTEVTEVKTEQELESVAHQEVSEPFKKVRPKYQTANLSLRTNLLPWATVAPSMTIYHGTDLPIGATMPNLELEYMFGGWGSVVVGGLYSRFSYDGNSNNLWGVSEFSVEPRFWFKNDGTYRGFNVGMQLKYGNFNVRDNKPLGHGDTGQFFAVGAMVNFYQPIVRNLGIEAGVGAGIRAVFDGATYHRDYEAQISETVEELSNMRFMLNFRLALVYRFGFK